MKKYLLVMLLIAWHLSLSADVTVSGLTGTSCATFWDAVDGANDYIVTVTPLDHQPYTLYAEFSEDTYNAALAGQTGLSFSKRYNLSIVS